MNTKSTILKVFIMLLFLLAFVSFSQNEKLSFEEFVIEDGLASVNCILKDKNGFMWFGGTHGLYRFDGYKFRSYTFNEKNKFSLSNNNIVCLFEDKDGFIWIGTMHGGLNKFNPKSEIFTNYINETTYSSIYNNHYITTITEDINGHIWVGTFGNGAFKFDKNNHSYEKYDSTYQNSNGLSNNDVFSIKADGNKVWITSNSGILDSYDISQKMFEHFRYSNQEFQSSRSGQKICIDSKGNIWISTEEEGLYQFNKSSRGLKHYKYGKDSSSISSNNITDIKEGKLGEIWFTTFEGLNLINTSTNEITTYKSDRLNPNSLTNNVSYSLYIDSDNTLWLGMGDGSVNKTINSPFEIYKTSFIKESNSLSFNVVVSLHMSGDNLWIGTGGGGLDKFDIKSQTFYNYSNNPNIRNSIPSNIVMSVFEDTVGNVWTGNFRKSLIGYKKNNTDLFFEAKFDSNIPINTLNIQVFDIIEDNKNNIWIASYNEGLYKYNKKTKRLTNYKMQDGLLSNRLLSLLIDKSGKLWIGSLDNGVQAINPVLNNSEQKLFELNNDNHFKINHPIKDIYEDNLGSIWFATEEGGVYELNNTSKNFTQYTVSNGLPSNSIYGIIQDNYNNLWFSTNKGIATLNTTNNKTLTYNTFDGLPTNDFESGAIAKTEDGKLFFGSKKGLVSFYPDQLNVKPEPINLLVTNFQIFNKDISANEIIDGYKPLDTSIVFTKHITLPHFLDNFSFEFATPGYQSPHNIKYEYMLEGLDDRWITTPSERHFANYSNISPGTYIFKVKATEENSIENENFTEKHIFIRITPVWWQTKIAYFIYFLIISSLIWFIYYNIKNRIRLKNELLIEKYKHDKDEELHQSKINFFTTISHELRTSLTLILTPLEELTKIRNTNNRTSNLIMTMNRNGQRLLNLVTQILDFRKLESSVTKLKVSELAIKEFFDELCIPFYQYANEKNIQFQLTVSNSCDKGWFDANKLEIIVYNMLSNAFKFAKKKIDINVDLDEKDERLIIKIKDNGHGISTENISKIFQDFYQVKTKESNFSSGTGIGLAITKNLVDIHYGEIRVKSELNEYTIFNIIIPITKKFYGAHEIVDTITEMNDSTNVIEEALIYEDNNLNQVTPDKKPILLIVEDNFEIRNLIKTHFSDDYKVFTSSDGINGCEKAFDMIPDIIISDIMMPKMNGLQLCKKLKTDSRTSHIPIILLTARGSHAFQMEGLEYGADDYLTKPFNLEILDVRVKNLVESRKALRETFRKEILLKPKDVAINNVDEIFIEKIMQIIETNMSDSKFSVAKLATEIGMSHSVLYRKIMALSGQNINEFLKTIRLTRAAQLILDSDYSINQISDMTGFSNPKYFSTCFKKKYGTTPTKYKERVE